MTEHVLLVACTCESFQFAPSMRRAKRSDKKRGKRRNKKLLIIFASSIVRCPSLPLFQLPTQSPVPPSRHQRRRGDDCSGGAGGSLFGGRNCRRGASGRCILKAAPPQSRKAIERGGLEAKLSDVIHCMRASKSPPYPLTNTAWCTNG